MSSIGTILGLPLGNSRYFSAKDEYGNTRTVHVNELPEDADVGDDYAYRIDLFKHGGGTTMRWNDDEDD